MNTLSNALFNQIAVEVMVWIINNIILFYQDVIYKPCSKLLY